MTGIEIPYDAWRLEQVDDHLLMNFRIINAKGKVIRETRDLTKAKEQTPEPGLGDVSPAISLASTHGSEQESSHELEQEEVNASAIDLLDQVVDIEQHGVKIKAYPALVKRGKKVDLKLLNSKQQAEEENAKALVQLFINALPEQIKHLKKSLPDIQSLCLKYVDFGGCEEMKQDIINTTIVQCFMQQPIKSSSDFEHALETGRSELVTVATEWCQLLNEILNQYKVIKKALKNPPLTMLDIVSDIQNQLAYLFPEHFLTSIDKQWLKHYSRYLSAIQKRLEKAQGDIARDRQHRLQITALWEAYLKRHNTLEKQHLVSEQLEHYRWMLEEYRVSLFAQELKTLFPVSEKRLKAYWGGIEDG